MLTALLLTHVTIISVTIYLHRAEAHRALTLRKPLAHFFRFWLWLTTGMVTKEWVAIHRKHHARCEMDGDPHSPIVWLRETRGKGRRFASMAWFIVWAGVMMYVRESRNTETLAKHGAGTPDDWIERNLYSRFSKMGTLLLLPILDVTLFGWPGAVIWVAQAVWIPIFAAGIVNGVGHFWGYRNFDSRHRKTGIADSSRNIFPWGILIGGEELHNNHHAKELSAKLSARWFEFDVGWLYIRIFRFLGLVREIRADRHA